MSTYKFRDKLNFLDEHIRYEQQNGPIRMQRDRAPNNNMRPVEARQGPVNDEQDAFDLGQVDNGDHVEARQDPVDDGQDAANQGRVDYGDHVEAEHGPVNVEADDDIHGQRRIEIDQIFIEVGDHVDEDDHENFDVIAEFVEQLHVDYVAREAARKRKWQNDLDILVNELFEE